MSKILVVDDEEVQEELIVLPLGHKDYPRTTGRTAMLQSLNGNESPVKINDVVNADGSVAGNKIIIRLPVLNN